MAKFILTSKRFLETVQREFKLLIGEATEAMHTTEVERIRDNQYIIKDENNVKQRCSIFNSPL